MAENVWPIVHNEKLTSLEKFQAARGFGDVAVKEGTFDGDRIGRYQKYVRNIKIWGTSYLNWDKQKWIYDDINMCFVEATVNQKKWEIENSVVSGHVIPG